MEIKDLTLENHQEHIQAILESEKIFPESVRLTSEQLLKILKSRQPIAKVAFHDSRYVGNAIAFCPNIEDIEKFGLEGINHHPQLLYLYNFVILPEVQGKGFGKVLFQHFIDAAKVKGYTHIEGHFRPQASLHIAKRMGAETLRTFTNWNDTREDYVHYRLKL